MLKPSSHIVVLSDVEIILHKLTITSSAVTSICRGMKSGIGRWLFLGLTDILMFAVFASIQYYLATKQKTITRINHTPEQINHTPEHAPGMFTFLFCTVFMPFRIGSL